MQKRWSAGVLLCALAAVFFLGGCAGEPDTRQTRRGTADFFPEEDAVYGGVAYALSVGDPEKAIAALEEARKRDPNSLETRQLYVDVLLIAGLLPEMREEINEILEAAPQNEDALYSLALLESAEGKTAEERRTLNRILEINPANDRAQAALGELLLREKNFAEAEKLFDKSLAANPKNLVALIGKGNAELRQSRAEAAIKTLSRAIEVEPSYPFAYVDRSRAFAEAGGIEAADEDISRAIELMPDFTWNYYDRGKLRANSGNAEGALADFNKALELDPDIHLAYLYRARILDGMGNMEAAYADYKRAQSGNSRYPQIHLPLAILEYKMGKWALAASSFIKAAEFEKNEPAYHLLAALCYKNGKNEKQAQDYLTKNMGRFPQGSLFYHMARYYMQPSSDNFIIQQLTNEKDKAMRARMLFYIAAQYTLQNRGSAAMSYFFEASSEASRDYIENRLAAWELKKLEGK